MMKEIQIKIIGLFSKQLDQELTIHQIKNKLNRSYHYIYDNASELIQQKMLNKKKQGHSTVCSLNFKNEKTKALLILNSIEEKEHFLKKSLKPLFIKLINNLTSKIEIFSIILFGSYAKGTESKQSDIDLLIITEKKDKNKVIPREIQALETTYGIEINPVILTKKMFEGMLWAKAELNVGKEALANHIVLHGAECFWKLVLEVENERRG